jgi:hypothetical protein
MIARKPAASLGPVWRVQSPEPPRLEMVSLHRSIDMFLLTLPSLKALLITNLNQLLSSSFTALLALADLN